MTLSSENQQSGPTLRGLALVVLAAGKSTRMGSPKALVQFEGRPLLEHLLAPGLLRELGDVVVVLGHHADVLRPIVDRLGYRHVVNPDPDRGRTGSVQTGLRALGGGVRGVFVQPVDCPIILPATFHKLAEALADVEVVIPSYRGRHGHPPLFSAAIVPRILAARPDEPLRDVLQGRVQGSGFRGQGSGVSVAGGLARRLVAPNSTHEARCRFVEVDDPGVLVNIDVPDDLEQLTALRARVESEE